MIALRLVSSLEKIFPDEPLSCSEFAAFSALRGERLSFQVAYTLCGLEYRKLKVEWNSDLPAEAEFHEVGCVPAMFPAFRNRHDEDYLRLTAGLFPDVLLPYPGYVEAVGDQWRSLWCTLTIPENAGGDYTFTITLYDRDQPETEPAACTGTVHVVPVQLPKQELIFSQWFHCDCLSEHYKIPVFSGDFWPLLERYLENAVRSGINMLLTPIFTPPLDTAIGGERPTTQLVGVRRNGTAYIFDFSLLERFIKLAQKKGIRYFEISHLFTQWGAAAAPKVMAETETGLRRIFGWDTPSDSPEYVSFLRQLLPALKDRLKELGVLEHTVFHLSDEPSQEHMENYLRATEGVKDLLADCYVTDALSNYEYYRDGLVPHPIPSTNHIEPFLEGHVRNLWTYYCCGQCMEVGNRFLAMPSYRNRILGLQLYKYNIRGFLQWGYNFWFRQYSLGQIDPFRVTDAGNAWPAGDPFSVYPGDDGYPIASLRQEVFYDALQDIRALKCLEQWLTQQEIQEIVEEGCEEPLTFRAYPRNSQWLLRTRERINQRIEREASSR